MHPYSTNSPATPKLIAYIMLAAVVLSGVVGILVNYANTRFGWPIGSLSAMTLFTALYFLFDRVAWRWKWARSILLVPDLNGTWDCQGKTLFKSGQPQEFVWTAKVTIKQSWSRITVCLKTAQSASHSIAASLYREPGSGYRLIYHYDNRPAMTEMHLSRHCGLCNLLFSELVDRATGEYFTDKDRMTAGTMQLSREGAIHEQT